MKATLIVTFLLLTAMVDDAAAQYRGQGGMSGTGSNLNSHYVSPHMRSDGALVGGHMRSNSNGTQLDNFGTRGNTNPYTGAVGTRGAFR